MKIGCIEVEFFKKTLVWKKEPGILLVIQNILFVESIYSLPEFRTKAFSRLLKIANGDNEKVMKATLILTKIAEFNSVELKDYLKPANTGNISRNFQKISHQMLSGDNGKMLLTLIPAN